MSFQRHSYDLHRNLILNVFSTPGPYQTVHILQPLFNNIPFIISAEECPTANYNSKASMLGDKKTFSHKVFERFHMENGQRSVIFMEQLPFVTVPSR